MVVVVVDGCGGGDINGSKKACNLHPQDSDTLVIIIIVIIITVIIIIFIIIIIIILGISFMQGMYTYIPDTNHVPREHCVATILM
jgi:heme/copper-type cytochrome/quinol oxidase subunit 2